MLKHTTKKGGKKLFRILTGVIVGGAIGSILGLTLAPKRGEDSRKYIRDKSIQMFLKGKTYLNEDQEIGFFKRLIIKLLTRKK